MKINFWGVELEVPDNTKYITMDSQESVELGSGIIAWRRKPKAHIKVGYDDHFWICKGDLGTNVELACGMPKVKWNESLVKI